MFLFYAGRLITTDSGDVMEHGQYILDVRSAYMGEAVAIIMANCDGGYHQRCLNKLPLSFVGIFIEDITLGHKVEPLVIVDGFFRQDIKLNVIFHFDRPSVNQVFYQRFHCQKSLMLRLLSD